MYKLFTHQDPIGRFKSPEELKPEIPHELSELILKCLATTPENRPSSADEIKDTLLLLLRGAHIHTEQRQRVQKDFKQFQLLDMIKEDAHSSVMLFENRSSRKLIVIKKRPLNDAGFTEAKLLTPLKHPNIINILGTSENKKYYIIVMEYLNSGNLQERLVQTMKWQDFIPLGKEIASGMQFAQLNRIIHGNLRPSNILFDNNGHIKLTDFGLEEHYSKNAQNNNWYRLKKEKVSSKMDIFSCGVIFYQMLVGNAPVLDEQRFTANITFKKLPLKLKQLIIHMLKIKPQDRTENFSLVVSQLDEVLDESGATIVIPHKPLKKEKRKPVVTPALKKIIYLLVLLSMLLTMIYFFADMSEIQYFIEDIFYPPEEIQTEQPNFIDF
ncbi:MAG: protein kinase [gamma proteobacterium symbiont of Bathyaustriella thionipta]|nr:protein kinase [gamma proteobacterium symbiont of Bathyaustriella thionipta]MCU7948957.1 protein kinase [gamma proteobacterium symbiont of Bathyaustriella thionipta]MCU7953959.1 protein kinase [gamma proteobacterium symbiont of Bathyaustriella thionipta]MCU7955502.1 protein kinase [gamma proteobacterium symbiont of Bathyaustriella thionipta]MCU7967091.1 protein kinase [gamma proteobacterium symbiont of Bathyaustriella thionipta]